MSRRDCDGQYSDLDTIHFLKPSANSGIGEPEVGSGRRATRLPLSFRRCLTFFALATAAALLIVGIYWYGWGEPRVSLGGHSEAISAVAFSPDGLKFASASSDQQVLIRDTKTWKISISMKHYSTVIRALAFSPDSKHIATACDGDEVVEPLKISYKKMGRSKVKLCEVATGKVLAAFGGDWDTVTGLAYTPDGNCLAICTEWGRVVLWDLTTMRERASVFEQCVLDSCNALAFSPNGRILASVAANGKIRIWEVDSLRERFVSGKHNGEVTTIAFSPDGKTIASGSYLSNTPPTGEIKFWDADTGVLMTILQYRGIVTSAAYSPDGRFLAVGIENEDDSFIDHTFFPCFGEIKLWEIHTEKEKMTTKAHRRGVRCLSFSPNGKIIATGGGDGTVKIWTAPSSQ